MHERKKFPAVRDGSTRPYIKARRNFPLKIKKLVILFKRYYTAQLLFDFSDGTNSFPISAALFRCCAITARRLKARQIHDINNRVETWKYRCRECRSLRRTWDARCPINLLFRIASKMCWLIYYLDNRRKNIQHWWWYTPVLIAPSRHSLQCLSKLFRQAVWWRIRCFVT